MSRRYKVERFFDRYNHLIDFIKKSPKVKEMWMSSGDFITWLKNLPNLTNNQLIEIIVEIKEYELLNK